MSRRVLAHFAISFSSISLAVACVPQIGVNTSADTPLAYPPNVPTSATMVTAYPPPKPTLSATVERAMQTESRAEEATGAAAATASMPAPVATLTYPIIGPKCFIDPLNRFSLNLPVGWYADPPPEAGAAGGASIIYNYDPRKIVNETTILPAGSLKIQFSSDQLATSQTIEQWLSDEISSLTSQQSPEPARATLPTQYTLGKWQGYAYILTGQGDVRVIVLAWVDQRILIIELRPAESTALAKGLSILADSLAASPESFCH